MQISNPTTITGTSTLSTLNGDINIAAPISIQAGTAANLTINAATGNVTTQDINLASAVGAGNSLTLLTPRGIVTTGNLNVDGTSGGNINIQARTAITTGSLSAVGLSGNGGNIFLDPDSDIFIGPANAQGFGGVGGTVDLTSNRFVRISGTFVDQNGLVASVSTAGTAGDGVIIIRHDGGTRFEPFNVFSSLINGTDGVLTTGAGNTIFTPRSFPGPYTQGNIQIITAPNFTIFLATQPLKEPPRVQWVDEGDRAPFPPEEFYTREFEKFFSESIPDLKPVKVMTLAEIQETLRRVQSEVGVKPALLYVTFMPDRMNDRSSPDPKDNTCYNPKPDPNAPHPSSINLETTRFPIPCDILELTLVTANGKPTYIPVKDKFGKYIRRSQVEELADAFRRNVATRSDTRYVSSSKEIFNFIVDPITKSLQDSKIQNITFILPENLRGIPFAALKSSRDKFIVEDYSVGLMPSLSLTDTRRSNIAERKLLPLGVSIFDKEATGQDNLENVPKELEVVANIWKEKPLLNEQFTKDRLENPSGYSIIHLATHADFDSTNEVGRIYLQKDSITLNDIRQYNWNNLSIELLVLSACQTAEGSKGIEFGFSGAAVRANVKSVVGSLWLVDDEFTPTFMERFYRELKKDTNPIKAQALRSAQVNIFSDAHGKYSHPRYWSKFTLVGNPW